MKLHELSPAEGSAKAAWRKGRGPGSGNGRLAGKEGGKLRERSADGLEEVRAPGEPTGGAFADDAAKVAHGISECAHGGGCAGRSILDAAEIVRGAFNR